MTSEYSRKDIIRLVGEEDVGSARLQFTDVFGMLKNVVIISSQLERALGNRYMFGDSAIEDFVRVEGTDTCLYPDLGTFEILPWRPQQGKVVKLMCDIYCSDNAPFEGDPRYVLRKALKEVEDMEYRFNVRPECEFSLFHIDEGGRSTMTTHEMAGYFDVDSIDLTENVHRGIVLDLEEMRFEIESPHYEIAPAQHEVDFKYAKGLVAADNILTFKMAVKIIAKHRGLHAMSIPKPEAGVSGSGAYISMSLEDRNGKNVLTGISDELGLDEAAYQSMAGIPTHIKNMIIFTNPVVNSYKRLILGRDAPTYVGWLPAMKREQLVRIPSSRGESTCIELRPPDSAVSLYLALATCLATGLDGIKKSMVPSKTLNVNVSFMDEGEWEESGVSQLPKTLGKVIEAFEDDEFLMSVLDNHIYTKYLETREKEWGGLRAQVIDWGTEEYLYKF